MLEAAANPDSSSRRPSFLDLWIWFAMALGVLLRVVPYFRNRSLWYDEALLALNILHRSVTGLMSPLDYHQAAPVGFLLLEKISTGIFGKNELALRLVPLIFGIAALFVVHRVAALWLSPQAVPIAVSLFALNPSLIYYSSEVKQYSCDVAVALVLLWAAGPFQRSGEGWRSAGKFALLGFGAIWFSHPSMFILAGAGPVLLLYCQKEWKDRKSVV